MEQWLTRRSSEPTGRFESKLTKWNKYWMAIVIVKCVNIFNGLEIHILVSCLIYVRHLSSFLSFFSLQNLPHSLADSQLVQSRILSRHNVHSNNVLNFLNQQITTGKYLLVFPLSELQNSPNAVGLEFWSKQHPLEQCPQLFHTGGRVLEYTY